MSRSESNRIDAECPSAMENIKVEGDTVDENVKHGRRSSSISDSAHNNGSCDNGGELFGEMPEVFSCLGDGGFGESGLGSKTNKLQKIIEDSISSDSKQTVSGILDQVNGLSTAEKLLLYLRLPSSKGEPIDPLRQPLNPLGNRFEIHQTITWIRTHLEEDQDVSLPKQDVYEEYTAYCNNNTMKPLSTADFGKVMKQVFPSVRPRRLGTRGNSRYCYAGMRKRTSLQVPLLPDLAGDCTKPSVNAGLDADILNASSCLVREWAEKLLSVKFDTLHDLACHLVENVCVDSRSVSALTLLSALEPNRQAAAGVVSPSLQPGGKQVSKHRETQLQLQRKLQEREVIREQKRKLQVQQQSSGRSSSTNDKPRAKRPKLSRQSSVEDVKPAASALPPAAQEVARAVNRPPSNCDKKQPSGNRLANGKEEFVDYSTIGLEGNSGNLADGVARGGNRFADLSKVVNGSDNSEERNATVKPSNDGGDSKTSSRFPEKSRHLSLDFETSGDATSPNFNTTFPPPVEGPPAPERQKSSLQFYLERTPLTTKPESVSPDIDYNNDLLPSLLRSQISPPAVPKSGPLVPPPAPHHPPHTEGKVLIPRLPKPRRETPTNLVIFPSTPVTLSPKHKYKPIQPKVDPSSQDAETDDLPSPAMGKEGSAFFPPNAKKSPAKLKPPANKSAPAKSPPKKPRTPKTNNQSKKTNKTAGDNRPSATSIPPRARNEVSIGCLEKDALDDYLHGGSNSQEQEEELLQIFQQGSAPPAPAPPADNNNEKLSQLRLLLERNISSAACRPAVADISRSQGSHSASHSLSMLSHRNQLQQRANLALPSTHADGYHPGVGTRRRVSFETSVVDAPVPQSPNTRRRIFSFTPISPGPHSPLGRATSKPSSANASPFVSPRNTPVPRSRNNSTQAKSHGAFLAGVLNGGNRVQNVDGGRGLASFAGQSLNSLMANGGGKSRRQTLQRSSSVNGELASRYLGASLSIGTGDAIYAPQAPTDCNTFAMPPEQGPVGGGGDPFARHYGQISASAPQSPLVHYHSPNVNPFTFKARANSFEGASSQLLEEMLRAQQATDVDTFMGSNVVDVTNRTSIGDVNAVEATSVRHQADLLSREVSQFSADSASVSNFAQMQYRSQSVPLHRMTDAMISPRNGTFTYASAATSMAPTPVPSEYQDFDSDALVLDSAENDLSQIFNLLDARYATCQDDTQIKLDSEEPVGSVGDVHCLNAADLNGVVLNGEKLPGAFDETLILPQSYDTLSTNGQQQSYDGSELNGDGRMSMDVVEELSPSYENAPLPYKSTFEYVTDGSYRTFALGAAGENGCGARRNINVLLEPTYYADGLGGVLPGMADGDHVSQLEQQVDKL